MENGRDLLAAFETNKEYFDILRNQRLHSALAEPEVISLVLENARGNILDAGCGEGTFIKWIFSENRASCCYGIDISPIGIEMAKQGNDGVHFRVGDLREMPYEDAFFDLIYCQSVLEHISNYEEALKEFHRVLKPGGKLIIRVHNGGREGCLVADLVRYVFNVNSAGEERPSLVLRPGNLEDHRHNFDVNRIPSDVLLRQLRNLGFEMVYFTTRRRRATDSSRRLGSLVKKHLYNFLIKLEFFPFTHIGPTIVLMAKKS